VANRLKDEGVDLVFITPTCPLCTHTVNVSEPELHRWFWGDTAVAQLIRAVSQRMSASDDPALTYFAYGLAR
jgi:hypothetical protein